MAGEPIGLLLVLTTAPAFSVIATDSVMVVITPDEAAAGVQLRILAEAADNAGNVAFDSAPQVTIWHLDSSGVRTTDVATTSMTSLGEAWYYDWTPSSSRVYTVQVAGLVATVAKFDLVNVTVRPKFDPIALGVEGVLVSRM